MIASLLKRAIAAPTTATQWLVLTTILAIEKLVVYIFDSNPQVFLGDSMSYLATALGEYLPPDRSVAYGYVIHGLVSRSRSLSSLVAVQTLAGILTALLVAVILVRFIRTPFFIAAAAAFLFVLDPMQLMFERFVLTESLSGLLFVLFIFFGMEYIRGRRIWALVVMQAVGMLLIAFRASFVPMIVASSILTPVLSVIEPAGLLGKKRLIALALRLAVSLALMVGFHSAYKRWNGNMMNLPPAYTYADGIFLLANVSPIVKAVDTDRPELVPVLERNLAYVSASDQIGARNAEMFAEDGLVVRVQRTVNDTYTANLQAKRIGMNAMRRDPGGFIRLAFGTYKVWFSRDDMTRLISDEAGVRQLNSDELAMLSVLHLDARGLPVMKTLTRQYFQSGWIYFLVLLHAALLALLCVPLARPSVRRFLWLLIASSGVNSAAVQVMGVLPSPRHMHSMSIVLAVVVGVVVARIAVSLVARQSDVADSVRAEAV